METKRIIIAFALSILVLILWEQMLIKHRVKYPSLKSPTTQPATTSPIKKKGAFEDILQSKAIARNITIGRKTKDNSYKMICSFTSLGGSLVSTTLTEFAESVRKPTEGYKLIGPVKYPNKITRMSLTTTKLIISSDKQKNIYELSNINWFHKIIKNNEEEKVEFWFDITEDNKPILRISKIYTLQQKSYELKITYIIKNLTPSQRKVQLVQSGPIGIRKEAPRTDYRKVFYGVRVPESHIVKVGRIRRTDILKRDDLTYPVNIEGGEIIWAGQANKYFAAILTPTDPKGKANGKLIADVCAKAYSTNKKMGEDLTTIWTLKPMTIPPNGKKEIFFEVFLGPKSSTLFASVPKYIDRNYSGMIEYTWCTMQWLADLMVLLLKGLYKVTQNYGLAIILMVLIVRFILHPITKSSQLNMMRMQKQMKKLQPKMQVIREKYKNNREAMNRAIMELYREEGINPASQMMGCLPMLLQMPIWVALWTALNNTFELRHQGFVLWIKDLAGPDSLIHFTSPINIPFLSFILGPLHDLNILPLILIVSMAFQQKFMSQPTTEEMDPAQAKQQKFMFYFMSIFFGIILYNAPSGLNLYILTSNFLGIIENKRIRKHLEQEESAPKVKTKKGPSWWGKMQRQVEELAREYEQKQKDKRK